MTQILDIKNKEFYSWTYHFIFFRIVQFVFWTENIFKGCNKKNCRIKDIVPIRGPAKPQLRKLLQLGHEFDGRGFWILNFKTILNFRILGLYDCQVTNWPSSNLPLTIIWTSYDHDKDILLKNSYAVVGRCRIKPTFYRHITYCPNCNKVTILKNVPIKICFDWAKGGRGKQNSIKTISLNLKDFLRASLSN